MEGSRKNWYNANYNHSAWFYIGVQSEVPTWTGYAVGFSEVPTWTGYAVGFELTRLYLGEHPSQRASTLFDKPSNSFAR